MTALERVKRAATPPLLMNGMTLVRPDDLAKLIAVAEAAKDCAEDLAAELEAKYGKTRDYPSEQRRYERDMESVNAVRAALSELDKP